MCPKLGLAALAITAASLFVSCAAPNSNPNTQPNGGGLTQAPQAAPGVQLTPGDAYKIGKRVWKNECGGTVEGLTSWNSGENFASLGIGHFIWYPAQVRGPYQESFPGLVRHLQAAGVSMPPWLAAGGPCPWPTRAAFLADRQGQRMQELRQVLSQSVPQQATFLANRFLVGTQKILAAANPAERGLLQRHIQALAGSPAGLYAMMDYVNFKGEGINPSERYQGQGWGLLQVLQGMAGLPEGQSAAVEFSRSAKQALSRRISLAPKNETQWKAGWHNRCDTYAAPF